MRAVPHKKKEYRLSLPHMVCPLVTSCTVCLALFSPSANEAPHWLNNIVWSFTEIMAHMAKDIGLYVINVHSACPAFQSLLISQHLDGWIAVTLQMSVFNSLPAAMTPLSRTQLSVSVGFKRLSLLTVLYLNKWLNLCSYVLIDGASELLLCEPVCFCVLGVCVCVSMDPLFQKLIDWRVFGFFLLSGGLVSMVT